MAIFRGIGGAGDSTTDATVTAVTEQAVNAANSATEAATSASAAATSATNASSSEAGVAADAATATTAAAGAAASETAAASSASSAATSATNSANSATASASSATDAQTAQTAAETAETNAATSASNASTSASNAATSASTATTQATNASNSATAAATSATNAGTSETNAASSASAAASSASTASASADAALTALDNFDDRYLGQKASDPTVDNDGNALIAGALYFNTTDSVMKVYEGSVWVAAYASLSGALLQANNLSDVANTASSRTNLGLGSGDSPTFAGVNFADNAKAIFGAGSDLQIYHDGAKSVIEDQGTGNLVIRGSSQLILESSSGANYLLANDGSDVKLYHNTAVKFATTSTGIDVTGTVVADGLEVNSGTTNRVASFISTDASGLIEFADNATTNRPAIGAEGDDITLIANGEKMRITNAGNVGIGISAPTSPLHVYRGTDGNIIQANGANLTWDFILKGTNGSTSNEALYEMGMYRDDGTTDSNTVLKFGRGGSVRNGFFAIDQNGTEALRIDEFGNVGINTTSPATMLELSASNTALSGSPPNNILRFNDVDSTVAPSQPTGRIEWYVNDAGGGGTGVGSYIEGRAVGGTGGGYLAFADSDGGATGATESMRLINGQLGIGTTSPVAKLAVVGGTSNASNLATAYSLAAFNITPKSTSGYSLQFGSGPADVPYIQMSAGGAAAGNLLIQPYGGNVGVGTTSPQAPLHVTGTIKVATGNAQGILGLGEASGSTVNVGLWRGAANAPTTNGNFLNLGGYEGIVFATGAAAIGSQSERARIDSGGNLLVGKTSDASAVSVQGINLRDNGSIVVNTAAAGPSPIYACRDTNGDLITFFRDGAVRGEIVANTSSVSYNTTSDYRLKENVTSFGNASSRVLQLNPVRFNFIGDSDTVDGFLAHEAQAVVPEAVTGEKDAVNEDGSPDYQGIDQSKLVPLLTAALQEALAEINALKARLDAANI